MTGLPTEVLAAGLGLVLLIGCLAVALVLSLWGRRGMRAEAAALRDGLVMLQRGLETGQRAEAESMRAALASAERSLGAKAEASRLEVQTALGGLATQAAREAGEQRVVLEARLRELGERSVGQVSEMQRLVTERLMLAAEAQAAGLAGMERGLLEAQGGQRVLLESKLREMVEQSAGQLLEIQRSVHEKLEAGIEKQMQGSFQRVIDQFAAVQRAMGDVQAVTSQIGDLKRIFSNVKTRGSWGEGQLRAMLQDMLPEGGWEANRRLRDDSDEVVEFVLVMPAQGSPRPVLAVDAKFPAEDYDRLLLASEAGQADEERAARKALEVRLRGEARKIASKYIVPPVTVDFAVMYLPTDGLYIEASRMPGLIESLGREHRVLVMGPALLPGLIRTVHIGSMSLVIAENALQIQRMLGAVRGEFRKIDEVLGRLEKQTGTMNRTVSATRVRTRAMERTLRDVEVIAGEETDEVLKLEASVLALEDEE